jgi:hypothetical protein
MGTHLRLPAAAAGAGAAPISIQAGSAERIRAARYPNLRPHPFQRLRFLPDGPQPIQRNHIARALPDRIEGSLDLGGYSLAGTPRSIASADAALRAPPPNTPAEVGITGRK